MERVLTLEEALQVVRREAGAVGTPKTTWETTLWECPGEVLAEPLLAPRDAPAFDRSTRDGFAVRADDVNAARAMRVLGTVGAGSAWRGFELQAGEAVEIMTGAPVPAGADAVLMVEHASLADGHVRALAGRSILAGENIVPQGAEARAGDTLLPAGTRMDAAAIALAASCGRRTLQTFMHPTVGILATGDELVELDEYDDAPLHLGPHQIFNSNTHSIAALVEACGGQPQHMGIARDNPSDLRMHIAAGMKADLLLLSGGVSMGKFDFVEQVLRELGAEFFFTGVRIQPGKPVVFGRVQRGSRVQGPGSRAEWLYFFGLPGNPVSTEVCFYLLVAPLLRAMGGEKDIHTRFVEAAAAEPFAGKPGLVRFLPCRVEGDWRGVSVRPVAWQGSGDVTANARANGFCVVEEGGLTVGQPARVLLR